MDHLQFDFLAKAAHTTPSRRRFFAGVAGVAAALVAGRVSLDDALAQGLSANQYDLTCRQSGATFYCTDGSVGDPNMQCGPGRFGCRCARTRQNDGRVCVDQPGNAQCPKRRGGCRKNSECGNDEVCIKVPTCCPRHPGRGICAKRCNE